MCGISIIFHANKFAAERAQIEKMNKALHHRGPDDQSIYLHEQVALGHTRLSIVDIDNGRQPMTSADGRYVMIFNGEIYNYRELRKQLESAGVVFRTRSDTEVILELYARLGSACVPQLRGMFAFAVYDIVQRSVYIVRDRLGIKPLFYHWDGAILVAASEIKAILASGLIEPKFNYESIYNYFIYQFSISPHTPFNQVLELPAGHEMFIGPGDKFHIRQYWDLQFPREGEYESMDEQFWLRRFQEKFEESVASHTIGDVPIGAYLSGGIDSSAITWLLTKHYSQQLTTFSIHQTNPGADESAAYRAVAQHLHVGNMELTLDDSRPDYIQILENSIYHLEQPQRLTVDVPHFLLSSLVNDQHYKVIYSGDGADEILGGYDCFRQDAMRQWGNQLKNYRVRRRHYLREYTQWFAQDYIRLLLQLHKTKNQHKTIAQFGCYPVWNDFWHITEDLLPGLFTQEFISAIANPSQMPELAIAMKSRIEKRHPLNQSLYLETKTRLPGWILWKSDRLSMAHSVEARVPFMDHPLVELAAGMPPAFKLNGMDEKYVLRKIAAPHLPEHPTQYKKRAFYSPIREWFFTAERSQSLEPFLSVAALRKSAIFNPEYVHMLLRQLQNAAPPATMHDYYPLMKREWLLMLVLTTQMLYQQFIEKKAPCFS